MRSADRIRLATHHDRDQVVAVVQQVASEFGLPWNPQGADEELFGVPGSYTDRGGWFYVVTAQANDVVGTMGLVPAATGVLELRKMYLLPTARGRGTGRRLAQFAIELARTNGFARLELETAAVLEAAVALYRSVGFESVGRATCQRACDARMALALRADDGTLASRQSTGNPG